MQRPWRRIIIGASVFVAIVAVVTGVRISLAGKQALDNIDAMIVPTMVLPKAAMSVSQPTSVPQPRDEAVTVAAQPTATASPRGAPIPEPTAIPSPDKPISILLLGTDARPGDTVSRTDTIIVVRVDPRTERISVLSLPRDLWVTIPEFGKANINAAYPIGEKQLGKGYGAALAKQTVSELLGFDIDYFMMVNFDGFKALIDRLGGVYIDVPQTIIDPAYPTENYGTIKVRFDAGRQLMDGEHALIYARTRHADNDFGRIQRQQQVLMAVFQRVRDQGLLSQLTSLDDYTDALRDHIRTDMPRSQMLSLASIAPRFDANSIERFAVKPPLVIARDSPYRLLISDQQGFQQLVKQMTSPIAAAGGETVMP